MKLFGSIKQQGVIQQQTASTTFVHGCDAKYLKFQIIQLKFVYIVYILYICSKFAITSSKTFIMDTTISTTRRKIIDIPEDVFRYLSIKAASNGTNLKRYIENLLKKDVEDMDDNAAYAYLSKEKPDGHIMVGKEEKKDFEKWLNVESK